jgi:hypothetical protein
MFASGFHPQRVEAPGHVDGQPPQPSTSSTQMLSHAVSQQKASPAQTQSTIVESQQKGSLLSEQQLFVAGTEFVPQSSSHHEPSSHHWTTFVSRQQPSYVRPGGQLPMAVPALQAARASCVTRASTRDARSSGVMRNAMCRSGV